MDNDKPPASVYAAVTILLGGLSLFVLPPLLIFSANRLDGVIAGWGYEGFTEAALQVWNVGAHFVLWCIAFSVFRAAASCLGDRTREEEKK